MFCRILSFLTFATLLGILATPAFAQARPAGQAPAKQQPAKARAPKKVWTNEDLEALRGRVPISTVGEAAPPAEATAEASPAAEGAARPAGAPYSREKDPEWYRQRLSGLRAELDRIDEQVRRLREQSRNPTQATNTVALGAGGGLSQEDQIATLERRRSQVQQQIDELEDQARRNGIEPSRLR